MSTVLTHPAPDAGTSAKQSRSSSIVFKLGLLVTVCVAVAVALAGWLSGLVAERIIKESINSKLQLAVTDRHAMVQAYVAQQHERVGLVASRTQFRRLIQGYYGGDDLTQMRENTRRILNDARRVTKDFAEIWFATPEGKVITATHDELLDDDFSKDHDFREGLSRSHLGVPTSANGHYHALTDRAGGTAGRATGRRDDQAEC